MFASVLIPHEHLQLEHAESMWDTVTKIVLHILIPNRKHPTWTSASAELEWTCRFWAHMGIHVCTCVHECACVIGARTRTGPS